MPNAEHPLRSSLIGPDYWGPFCQAVFGMDKISGEPNTKYYNDLFGALDMQADNILFVNSIEDPWQYAGMRTIHNADKQKNSQALLIDCNNCAHC